MRILGREDGAALVTALMLTMLSLVIAMALLATVITGTRVSGSQKRYRSALSAAQGGVELLTREIIPTLFQPGTTLEKLQSDFSAIELRLPQYDCLRQKLSSASGHWPGCSAAQGSADPSESPDAVFKLKGEAGQGFTVATKIVDTVPGNSDNNSVIDYLDQGSSVSGRDEAIRPQHVPGLYNVAVQGERAGGVSREKARLTVLYAY